MLAALQQRLHSVGKPYRALLMSDALMLVALMVGHIAVPWWIAHRGGAPHLALYGVVMAVAAFISMPLLSPLGDRYAKRTLITAGMLVFTIEGLLIAILATFDLYRIHWILALEVWPVFAMSLIMPASISISAELVAGEHLADAMALQKSAQASGRLIGPAIGGGALAIGGTALALWLHVALALAAAILANRIPGVARGKGMPSASHFWRDLKAGMRAQWRVPVERGRNAVSFLVMVCFGPAIGMLVPLKVQSLGLSGSWFGACEASLSLGMLAGALGCSAWLAERFGRFGASIGAIMAEGLALALIGYTATPILLVIGFAVTGMGVSVVVLVGQTHRMLAIPDHFRARMTAVSMMVMQIAGSLGPALAGIALGHFPVGPVYIGFGLLEFLCAFGYYWVPRYREFLSLDHAAVKGWFGREYPAAFAEDEGTSQQELRDVI